MMNIGSSENLMKAYQAYSFAAYDALLYLDAYPEDKAALESYNKYQKMAQRAKAEYEMKYGPISPHMEAKSWQWTDAPWPWQNVHGRGERR